MTLVATAVIDQVDAESDEGYVVVRAIATGDAIDANTEGGVAVVEIAIKCLEDPGLKVGETLAVSTHFVKRNPDEPQTPANTVGSEATATTEGDVNVNEEPESQPNPDSSSVPAEVGPGSAQVDSPVPAGQEPAETSGGQIPAETAASIEANAGSPDGPGLGQVDAAVPADAGPVSDPNSPEGGVAAAENVDGVATGDTTEPAPEQETPAS